MSGWISVDVQLPDIEKEVIGFWHEEGPVIVVWDGLHWGDPEDLVAIGYHITHWMPLPDPPEVKP